MKISKQMIFTVLFIVSVVVIFFVGRKFDPETGARNFILTPNGISHFRKGLDVSGGTKLVYKISYDKYEKVYTNVTELAAIKKTIETIIMKNIDSRISKLGVSDYKAYVQNLDDQNYIVVEIGGIADLDQAKELIGKTLELEFKLQNLEEPTKTSIAARKALAEQVLLDIKKDPKNIQKMLEGRMSENIYHNVYTGNILAALPDVYKNNPKLLDDAEIGKIYGLIDGNYATVYQQDDTTLTSGTGVTLDGYTMFRLLDKKQETNLSGETTNVYTLEDVFVQDRDTSSSN